jgi:hypothetical protein
VSARGQELSAAALRGDFVIFSFGMGWGLGVILLLIFLL